MIAIVDLQSIGRDHIPFNTAFLRMIRKTAPGEQLILVCREDHRHEIGAVLSEEDIGFVGLPPALHDAAPGRFVAHHEQAHFAFVESFCREHAVDRLILLGVRADLLDRARRRPPASRVDILFHATLAEPLRWRSRNPLRRRRDMFGVLRRRFPPSIRLIFLEKGIARQAAPLLAEGTRVAVLPHPILGDPFDNRRPVDPQAINVGFLGEANSTKGFEHFLALARLRLPRLRLHSIGRASPDYDRADDPLFATPPSPGKLSQAAFDRAAGANDVIFLPLPHWYNLTASGTLLDCVRFGIPPVVVRNAVVDLLEADYGQFGFIVDSAEEGIALIGRMNQGQHLDALPRFSRVLHAIAEDRTVDAAARRFAALADAGPQTGAAGAAA